MLVMARQSFHKLMWTLAILLMQGGNLAAIAQSSPPKTTVCEVAKNPGRFDNQIVQLTATLAGNFEISAIRDPDHEECGSLWFTYPGSGPGASVSINSMDPTQPRPSIALQRDDAFRHFQTMVDARMYPRRRKMGCMDCGRYEVTPTMTGLVESAKAGHGFGHMNGFPVQFVLQSILSTSAKDLAARYPAADFSTIPIRFPTGYFYGVLFGPDGKAIADADLTVYSPTDPEAHIEDDSATTDDNGRFRFSVPPGRYIIGFNTFWPPSPQFPYPATYYPSSRDRSGAQVLSVKDREHQRNLVFRLPKALTPRTIPVRVSWPDGTPIDGANVWLSPKDDPTAVVGTAVSHTTKDGNYDLTGFEGYDYILRADKYGGKTRESCIKPLLIRASKIPISRIRLLLESTDCANLAFEVPTDSAHQ
jgi:hypothetical protein